MSNFFLFLILMYLFSRDQRLHKLVFEYGGLPDGSEVAYYARGQVVKQLIHMLNFLLNKEKLGNKGWLLWTEIARGL